MVVWIVERRIPYEGMDVQSVWASEAEAIAEAVRLSDDDGVTMRGHASIGWQSYDVQSSREERKGGPVPCS